MLHVARVVVVGCLAWTVGCAGPGEAPVESSSAAEGAEADRVKDRRFSEDVAFLAQHAVIVALGTDDTPGRAVVVPEWQGRVMTSTVGEPGDVSLGWINYGLIASGEVQPHINALGGEDRFWMGPEGGQFSIFFAGGDSFDLEHWQTPAVIDTDAYEIVSTSTREVVMRREASLTNYSGTRLDLRIDRTVRLLDRDAIQSALGAEVPADVRMVGFESVNTLTNTGSAAWTKDTGLLSVWILGMFKHSPETTVAIPFRPGSEADLGPVVNDAYFGKVPADRLRISDGVLFFKGDGRYRSKIGLSPGRALPVAGSYDATRGVLTLVQYTLPDGATDYVNSMWEMQDDPYGGDVINSYNDGPPEPGATPLGPFYELETSSPAAALGPGGTLSHTHRTVHLEGSEAALDAIARPHLGAGVAEIASALR